MKALLTLALLVALVGCNQPAVPSNNANLAEQLAEQQRKWETEKAKRRQQHAKPVPPAPYFAPDEIIDIR